MKSIYHLAPDALPMLTNVPKPRALPIEEIRTCKNDADAVKLCLRHRIRKINESEISAYLGIKQPFLVRVKLGTGNLNSDQKALLQRLCSNKAIDQYAAMRGEELDDMINGDDWEKRAMQREIEELKAKLAAA